MRRFPLLPVGILLALLVAACDGNGDGSDSGEVEPEGGGASSTATALSPTDDRREGGEVTIASLEFLSLDPHQVSSLADVSYDRMLWRGLYSLDSENQPAWEANGIAAGPPEVSEDGRTYTVRMNPDLSWSDGDDLTAEDYVAGILHACNPVVAGTPQHLLTNLVGCDDFYNADPAVADLAALAGGVGVRAVDDLTIEFRLNEPQPTFPIMLALWVSFPVPVHIARFGSATASEPAEYGVDPQALVYNGPYILTDYVAGDRATLEPNPNWSGVTSPTLDTITFRFIEDFASANNAYRTSEVQVSVVDVTQLATLTEEFGDEYVKVVAAVTRVLKMQLANPTLASLDVRLALARALDRETMNRVVAQGAHVPSTSWVPPEVSDVPAGTYDELIGFDPEAARAHLAAAGYPDGEGFPVLELITYDSPAGRALGEFVQSEFKRILNIDIEILLLDLPTFSARQTARDFEITVGRGFTQDFPDLENWMVGSFESDGTINHGNCNEPEIDMLIDAARYNPNDEERLDLYRQAERRVIELACGVAPYWHESKHYLIKPELTGFKENATSQDAFLPGDWRAEAWGLAN